MLVRFFYFSLSAGILSEKTGKSFFFILNFKKTKNSSASEGKKKKARGLTSVHFFHNE